MARKITPEPKVTKITGSAGSHGYGREATHVTISVGQVDSDYVIEKGGAWKVVCGRCGGTGHRSGFEFVYGGVCFECSGSGTRALAKVTDEASAIERERQRWMRADRKRIKAEREQEIRRASFVEWTKDNQDVVDYLTGLYDELYDSYAGWYRDGRMLIPEFIEGAWNKAVIRNEPLSDKHTAAVRSYRAQQQERKAEQAARAAVARHAGELGEKVTVTGTVKVAMDLDGLYGSQRMIVVESADETVTIKTYTTAAAAYELESGDTVTVTATVKKLGEYKGLPQTQVNRPKFTDRVPGPLSA